MTLRADLPAFAALPALAAAALFGASTPLAKLLLAGTPALMLAGLLYLGSGAGLALVLALRAARTARDGTVAPDRTAHDGAGRADAAPWRIPLRELPWLAGAILFGGVAGPALLMMGLARTSAASASLLLNLEAVLTALLAWVVFRENAGRRVVLGMAAIVAAGMLLAWEPGAASLSGGSLLVVGACLCWAVDNNLTRKVSANDAMLIACLKGLAAGSCNTLLALAQGEPWPALPSLAACLLVGFLGYGVSLTLFVLSLRGLGTARTGAYFSVAPLFGVLLSFALWPEVPQPAFRAAAALMALGVWLHVTERHEHVHTHDAQEHSHRHRHDEHHRHVHDFPWSGEEPHTHPHRHAPITHAHPHYPDIHHRHGH